MPWPYKRNIAQEFDFPFFDGTGSLVNVSGSITKQVAINGQTFVNVSGSVNQYGTTGVYKFSGQAADWNGARLTYLFSEATVKPTVLTFHTDSKQFTDIPSLADLKAQCENAITAFEPSKASVSGRLLDVSAGGEAGLDWANIGSPNTVVSLGGTTIRGSGLIVSGIQSSPPPPPTSQDIWAFATRVITDKAGFSLAADQSGVTTGAVSGAVGSVTGNLGGNVVGSVGSVSQSGISPLTFGADVREQVAADVIKRGMVKDEANLENRSLGWAIAKLVNKLDMNAGQTTLTTRKTDDTTALFTQAITTSGGAQPVTAIDTT